MYEERVAAYSGSGEYIQILARRASIVFTTFVGFNAWFIHSPEWLVTLLLVSACVCYNLIISRREAPPTIAEMLVNLLFFGGLSYLQAEYSTILYHLLLLRMALRVGRTRAGRVAVIISTVYLGSFLAAAAAINAKVLMNLAFQLTGFGLLTYAAISIDALTAKQASDDRQMLELIKQNDRNYRMAHTDALTGLYNHRAYKENIDALSQYVLLVIDIDHFKKFNDTYGHLIGDKVLVALGNIIKLSVRGGDLAFRYGGEEFVVVLPGTTPQIGMNIAERLRQKVAEWQFDIGTGRIHLTVSIGMAVKKPGTTSQTVFDQADRALYSAKKSGRNNVQSYQMLSPVDAAVKYS